MPLALPRPYTLSCSCRLGRPPRTGDLEGTRPALRTHQEPLNAAPSFAPHRELKGCHERLPDYLRALPCPSFGLIEIKRRAGSRRGCQELGLLGRELGAGGNQAVPHSTLLPWLSTLEADFTQ